MAVFNLMDWTIVVFALALISATGYAVHKYIHRLSNFLVAERGMGPWVGTASLVSTEIGIITFIYLAQLGYVAGFSAFIIALVGGLAAYTVGKTGFVIKPLRELKIMTVPEFFQIRYSRGVRILAGLLMAFGGALNMGIWPKLEASFLNIVLGIRMEHLPATMAVLLLLVLLYTAAGGMVSLIITNYIQYLFLSVGAIVLTVMVLHSVGLRWILQVVHTHLGNAGFNPLLSPEFGAGFVIWQLAISFSSMTIWQSISMRTFASKDTNSGKKMFRLTGALFLARGSMPVFWGVAALAFFGGRVSSANSLAHLVARLLPHGLLGLVVAGLLATSLSSFSGYLLAWSSIISRDIVTPLLRRELSEKGKILLSRITVVGLTAFIMIWGLMYNVPGPAYFYLNITAELFVAATFVTVVGGAYWRRSSTLGAYLAFVLGALGASTFFLGNSPIAAGLFSFGFAFAGHWVGSMLRPNRRPEPATQEARA